MKTKPKEIIAIVFVLVVLTIIGLVVGSYVGYGNSIAIAVDLGFVIFVAVELVRRLKIHLTKEIRDGVAQNEAYMALLDTVKPRIPLPPTRGWAASPDFLRLVAQHIIELKPHQMVELGAGVSSIISGYILEKQGSGKLTSFEHDTDYANKYRQILDLHGLSAYIDIYDKPFKQYDINGKQWTWYDFPEMGQIDLLIIDGPPKHIQHLARYPALPLLKKHLKPGSVILADDTNRKDLQEIVKLWKQEFDNWSFENLPAEKGAYKIVVIPNHTNAASQG